MQLFTSRRLQWVPVLLSALCLTYGVSAQSSLTAQAPATQSRTVQTALAFRSPGVVLYNQVQGTATSGIVSQNNATATQFNNVAADDFTVTAGQTWSVTQMFARGFYTTASTPGTCASGDVTFYPNDPQTNKPGTAIVTRSGAPTTDVSGALTFTFAAVTLTAGNYWVSLVCNGPTLDLGVTGRWNWFYNTVQNMQPAQLRNDNGGFALPQPGWNSINTLGAGIGPDFDYSLTGTSTGTALLPELVLNPTSLSGTVASGGTTTVQLMIMNTGTADLTFSFPAFVTLQRIASLQALGIDLQPLFSAPSVEMPKGVESFTTTGGGTGAQYRVGGPDGFGYTFIDSTEPGGPVFDAALDIGATGTVQTLAPYTGCTAGDAQDEGRVEITLPFAFPFYGQNVTTLQVYANGVLGTDPALAACTFSNSATVPNVANPNGLIGPFWDDLDLGDNGRILTQQLADGRFVIQWDDVPKFGSAQALIPNTFQAILGADGSITFQYLDIQTAVLNSATIAIENQTGTQGLAASINAAGTGYIATGLAIAYSAPTRFISGVAPTSGTVAPGGTTTATVTLSGSANGAPIAPGTYMQNLTIMTNDADEGSVVIPVTLTVTPVGMGDPIVVTPSPVVETLASGATGTESVTLTNNTNADVTYSFPQYGGTRAPAPQRTVHEAMELGKGQADPRSGTQAAYRDAGGPDAFGYQWIDSNEPGGPTFAFVDISATGTALTLGDDASASAPIGFSFPFYGVDQTSVFVSSNGHLTFGTGSTSFTNAAIPTAAPPNNLIAPFWDDLDPGDGNGTVYYQNMGDGRFIVQYEGVPDFPGPGAGTENTFQVILNQSGSILFQYEDMNGDLVGSTVGIENATGTDGLQIAFNQAYIEDGLAILIQARPSFLTDIQPPSGTIPANGSVTVDFTFDATGLLGGQYTGEVDLVTSIDTLSVPVVLNVTGMPTVTIAPSPVAFGDLIVGFTDTRVVTITNNGTSDLVISAITSNNAAYTVSGATLPLTIAPGASATVTVTFTPTAVGAAMGTLSVVSNASTSPNTVMLTGNGLAAPAFSVAPQSLTFTVPQTQVSAPQTLTLSNTGAGAGTFDVSTALIVPPVAPTAPARQAATAAEAAKTLTGRMPATAGTDYLSGGDVVADGSFEAGTPNPFWTEASAAFGTPLCNVAGCGLGGGTGPRTGAWWTWFGGAPTGDVGSIEQSVTIPGGSAMLNFYLEIPLIAAGGTGFVAVKMDGVEVFRATYAADQATYATYALVAVDVSAYADGGSHLLRFESTTTGNGNFFVDDVSIDVEAGLVLTATPATGSVAAGGMQAIQITADATNAEVGVYQAEVRIATNDPANPVLIVPVTINVTEFIATGDTELPAEVTLYPSFPNPVAQATTIRYALPEATAVNVSVYDVTGRMVGTLVQGQQSAGFHTLQWDASAMASGLYFVRMQAGAEMRTIRLSVVR